MVGDVVQNLPKDNLVSFLDTMDSVITFTNKDQDLLDVWCTEFEKNANNK